MKSIKVGCADFPIGQKAYQNRLSVVETTQFAKKFPRLSTVEKWRKQAPKDFEFVSYSADEKTINQSLNMAKTLHSRILVFKPAKTMAPTPDNIGRIQRRFKETKRDQLLICWEPPIHWPESLIDRLSKSLQLFLACNPLNQAKLFNYPIQYFRLGGRVQTKGNYSFTDQELRDVQKACRGKINYVIFNNGPTSFKDALRFSRLLT